MDYTHRHRHRRRVIAHRVRRRRHRHPLVLARCSLAIVIAHHSHQRLLGSVAFCLLLGCLRLWSQCRHCHCRHLALPPAHIALAIDLSKSAVRTSATVPGR